MRISAQEGYLCRPSAHRGRRRAAAGALALALCLASLPAAPAAGEIRPEALQSVVSVLPERPGYPVGGDRNPLSGAPEGTGVAVRAGGYVVTAAHVLAEATALRVRLADGRILPAREVASDPPTDLALLKVEEPLPTLEPAPEPALGDRVCLVANAFGLDLSVTCGVVSALHRSGMGFNPIEDFIQTDATTNPGGSGGALIDSEGRLVGIMSAIFTRESDADIGVNFAVARPLVDRVVDGLMAEGRVPRGEPGFVVGPMPRAERQVLAGVRVTAVADGGAGAKAGLQAGDTIIAVGDRSIRSRADLVSAVHLPTPGTPMEVRVIREGRQKTLRLILMPSAP